MEQAVVKILLLGICGYGSNYIKEISERDIPGIKIEGICEVVPNAADLYPIIKEQNIPIYQTPEDFYKEHTADLAVVSTPIHLHYSQIVTCLTHGSNVLTEKPVCTSVEGARKLEQLEKETGKFISVGYQLNYSRDVLALKQDILDGRFGKPIDCAYVQANIGSADDRKKILDGALAAFGRVDVLVNNAGVAPKVRADLLDMSEESFDYVVGINTKGNMFLTQLVAKQMISQEPVDGRKGVIVNVSSCSSVVSSTNRGEYCVSKAGISMLTTLYADRLAAEGILVNEVRPGVIATDMTSKVQGKYDALIEKGTFPIARWGTPEDVAGAVSLLCSDRLRYTTGNYIDVDGGFHIQRL